MIYKPSKRFVAEQLNFAFTRKFMPGRFKRTTGAVLAPKRYWVECDCGGLDEGCACGGSRGRAGRRLVSDYRV